MFRSNEIHFCHKVCLVLVVKYQLNEIHDWNWSAEEEKQGCRKQPKSGWASSNVCWGDTVCPSDWCKVLSLLEACFDFILHENSNHVRKNYWKSGVQIPAPTFFVLFSFHLQILHKKLHIFVLNHFRITNQISTKTMIFNMFCLISN